MYAMYAIHAILQFWLSHPALLYGCSFLLGIYCHLENFVLLFLPLFSLWLPFVLKAIFPGNRAFIKPLFINLLVFFTAWFYIHSQNNSPSLPSKGLQGKAHIRILNVSLHPHLFGKSWICKCEILQFIPEKEIHSIASSLPCLIAIPEKGKLGRSRPLADKDYEVEGTLVAGNKNGFILKIHSKKHWRPILGTWSLAEERYRWKTRVSEWIEARFTYPLSGIFLSGLATGEFSDYWMRQQFSRFGIQHLLAISGFHFALTAGFINFACRFFFPRRLRLMILFFCLAIYCLFLGPQPSILRACIMCSLAIGGGIFEKQSTPLNSLGIALLILLIYHPMMVQEIGFQFSFVAAFAILLFYSPTKGLLNNLFPIKRLTDVLQMDSWNQHGYCFLGMLKQGLALTLAINILALPFTLYYFQQFPRMGFIYNLFYPFLASISLSLLILGSFLTLFPFLDKAIHYINDHYTNFILQLAYQIPLKMDVYIRIEPFHPFWLIAYFCLVCLAGIIWKESQRQEQGMPFEFI